MDLFTFPCKSFCVLILGGGHRQHLFKGKKPFENTLKLTIQSFRLWHWELTTGLDGFTSFRGCDGKFWRFNVILCSSSLRPPTAWLQISSSFRHNSTPPLGLHDHFFSRWTSESCEWKNLCHSSAFHKVKPQSQRVTRGDSEWTTCVTAPLLPKLCVTAENRTQVPFTQHGCINMLCPPHPHPPPPPPSQSTQWPLCP